MAMEPVKIGMVTTLSTTAGYLGEEMRDGFKLAIDQEGGKLGGIPVELLVEQICSKWGPDASYQLNNSSYQPHEANYLMLDCTKAHKKLGWSPRWNLDKAINSVIEWTKSYKDRQNIRECCQKQIHYYLNTKPAN